MSKLGELIQELCPNGVEIKELNEVIISLNTGLNPRKFFELNTENALNYFEKIDKIFPQSDVGQSMRWSSFKEKDSQDIFDIVSQRVLSAIKKFEVVTQKELEETQTLFDSLMQQYFG